MIPGRYIMVFGTFLLTLLLYIDRVCISVAKEPIGESLGFSDKMMGWVLSAFALGYALFQTPAGILADRLGPRKVLTAIVAFWSLCTALTGAAWNFTSMIVLRLLFGAGEAGAFPSIARSVYSWIPISERGLINGINFSGSRLGAAFALPLVAWLIDSFGWRNSFIFLGVIGIVWAVVWYIAFRDEPSEHAALSDKEKEYIKANRQQEDPTEKKEELTFGQLLKSKNMRLAMGQYFASNFTFFFALSWLYPHLKTEYGLNAVEAGVFAAVPLIGGAFGNWVSGAMIDSLYKKNKWNQSRRVPAIIGFSLATIGMISSLYASEVYGAVFFLTLAIFGADMTLSPSWSFCVDIGKKNSGAVSGTMNMAGNVGAFITALAFPYLQAWAGSISPFFYVAAILNFIAIFLWMKARPEKNIFEY
ncbi:MAG: MFS transporter [Cyclobacteriaceae bacterium]